MKKLALTLALVLTICSAAAQSPSMEEVDSEDLEQYREKINQHSDRIPGFLASLVGDQTINVRIESGESTETVGIKMEGTMVEELQMDGYENATLKVNTSREQVRSIASSEKPVQKLNEKLKNGEIEYDSEGYVNTIRTFIARQLLKLVSIV